MIPSRGTIAPMSITGNEKRGTLRATCLDKPLPAAQATKHKYKNEYVKKIETKIS